MYRVRLRNRQARTPMFSSGLAEAETRWWAATVLSKILDWDDRSTLAYSRRRRRRRRMEARAGWLVGFNWGRRQRRRALWLPGVASRHFDDPESHVKSTGARCSSSPRGSWSTRPNRSSGECGKTVEDVAGHLRTRPIGGHRLCGRSSAFLMRKPSSNRDRFGNTSSGSIPLALTDARLKAGFEGPRAHDRHGRRPHMGLGADRVDDKREGQMTKVAFCFPGRPLSREWVASLQKRFLQRERSIAWVPEASGLDLERLCFDPRSRTSWTRRSSSRLSSRRALQFSLRCERGVSEPDVVVGHSVGEFAALAAAGAIGTGEAIGLVRERGLAMAEAARQRPGTMAAILGLEDGEVENLSARSSACGRRTTTVRARSSSRRARSGRGVLRRGREPRRSTSSPAEGLRRIP